MKQVLFLVALLVASGASAQEMAPIYHNGSQALLTRDKGVVEIRYVTPRAGLPVREGTVLFSGKWDGRGHYTGMAYTFKRGCDPAPYPVSGKDAGPGIILVGSAPRRSPTGCEVIGKVDSGKNTRLVFEFEPEPDH